MIVQLPPRLAFATSWPICGGERHSLAADGGLLCASGRLLGRVLGACGGSILRGIFTILVSPHCPFVGGEELVGIRGDSWNSVAARRAACALAARFTLRGVRCAACGGERSRGINTVCAFSDSHIIGVRFYLRMRGIFGDAGGRRGVQADRRVAVVVRLSGERRLVWANDSVEWNECAIGSWLNHRVTRCLEYFGDIWGISGDICGEPRGAARARPPPRAGGCAGS